MRHKCPSISPHLSGLLHGADYSPEQWLQHPEILREDIRLMQLANVNVMSLGIFAWTALEPSEGEFHFEWLDNILDTLSENSIYVWLATTSGARPAWLSQKYPEVLRVGRDRTRALHGHRQNHCYTSTVYRDKVAIINERLARRYARHPAVIGWHVSNEYGGECHCPLCQEAFRTWLQQRYGTLNALNQAWWTTFWSHTFTDWSQIESPSPRGETSIHGMNLDWKRFVTDRTVDFLKHEVSSLRAAGSSLPVTTNFMEAYDGLDYWKLAQAVDIISWDSYPMWHNQTDDTSNAAWVGMLHDMSRSMKGGRPFVLMESTPSITNWQPVSKQKRPGMHMLACMQAVAHGADGIQYFQWRKSLGGSEKFHGAVVDHAGHEHTRVFREVSEVGDALQRIADIQGTTVSPEVAIIFDWPNRWAIRDAHGPRNAGMGYESTVAQFYKALWDLAIPVDVIDMDGDFSKYKVIVAPMMYMVREGVAQRIERFVEAGGVFVTTYWSGIVDENDLCFLGGFPGPLRRVLGIWSEEIDALYDGDRNSIRCVPDNVLGLRGTYDAMELCDLIHLEGAESLAVYEQDFYAGRPALTVHRFGQGSAYYVASRNAPMFHKEFLVQLAKEHHLSRVLNTDLPPGVTAQVRSDGESDFVFVMNFQTEEQQIQLGSTAYSEMMSGSSVSGELSLPGYGVKVLRRPSDGNFGPR